MVDARIRAHKNIIGKRSCLRQDKPIWRKK